MQPGMPGRLDAEGQQRVMSVIGAATAAETAPGQRLRGIAIQPFHRAAGEGASLGLGTRQPTIELSNAGALAE